MLLQFATEAMGCGAEQQRDCGPIAIHAGPEYLQRIAEDHHAARPNIAMLAGLDLIGQIAQGLYRVAIIRNRELDEFRAHFAFFSRL